MSKTTRYGIIGTSAAIAICALLFWQLSPATSAQEIKKVSPKEFEKPVPTSVISDNFDEILLNSGALNVKVVGIGKDAGALESGDGNRLHLVRFNGPIKSSWVDSLKREGLAIVDYIPHYTYLVWGNSAALQRVRGMAKNAASPLEWEGPYKPEYRIMPGVFLDRKDAKSGLRSDRFEIQLFKSAFSNSQTFNVIESLRTTEITGRQDVKHYVNFVVGLDAEGLRQLSELPDVISIHPYIEPQKFDERQNFILRGNLTGNDPTPGDWLAYLASKGLTQAAFDASNFVVDVSDSGVGNADPANENQFLLRRMGDPALPSRVVYSRLEGTANSGSSLQGCDGHGNINATIIGGYVPTGGIFAAAPHADASGYRYGLGVAPFVKIGSSVIFDPDLFTNPNLPNLQARAYNDGARISSNSWGSDVNGAYTATSQTFDVLVRDAQLAGSPHPTVGNQEMVVIFSAGNSGPGSQTIGAPGTSKNLITVGASENVHPFGGADACGVADSGADNANDIIPFSSRGPTTDGRKKPDIVLPGTHVTGGAAQNIASNPVSGTGTALTCFDASGVCAGFNNNFFPAAQQWYTASSGTSHSTPAIAGLAALIRQHFINEAPIGTAVGGGGTPPSPAMTKAVMINTASYMNGSGANDNLFSNSQGMGLADLENYFDIFAQDYILSDQESSETFTDSGQERVYTGVVADSNKPFRVTIAYSDAPGATTGNAFVNDLDLEVTVGGNSYKGNVFSGADSVSGGAADIRNNVESVFLPPGVSGNFLVRVKATNIAGDGLPGNADLTDQDFALVVWNGGEIAAPVISGGAISITAESCAINGAIDPAETVTVDFDLSNVGLTNTTDLVATLLPTGGVSSPSAPQNYGALAAGGGPVTRPFTFTATTTCGENLVASFQLQDGATDLGIATFTFLTGALATPTMTAATTGDISVPINDNSSVDIPIEVTTTGVLSDLNVKVRLNHTFDGDVQISITSPAGTTYPLSSGRGSSGDNFGTGPNDCSGTFTVFDDSAATAISAGSAPFAGSFRPESALSALNGQPIAGTWILTISDGAGGDVGTAGCAQLEIQRQRYVCCGVPGSAELVSGGAPILVSESFVPQNGTPDPGETVTYDFSIINGGNGPTTNLVATLQNSGGVTPITTFRSYGALQPAAGATSQPFTFAANGPCGGTVTATFQLQDGATNHGTIGYTFQLGTTGVTNQEFSNPASISIPSTGAAGLYPSVINVTGAPSTISRVRVQLNGFSHTYPADVDVLLVSPTGRTFIVVSDAGDSFASTISNQTLTFEDTAAATLPVSWSALPAGPYKPTNHGSGDTFAGPAPTGPYLSPGPAGIDAFASAFGGAAGGDPNGNWSLFVTDDFTGDTGSISGGWTLTLLSETAVCSTMPGAPTRAVRADFDADGKTDLSVFRPNTGVWWINRSTAGFGAVQWGNSTDVPFSGDFWGDRHADFAIYRGNVSDAHFWLLNTNGSDTEAIRWGLPGDIPLSGDYNGDGVVDIALYRGSESVFYIFTRGANVEQRIFPYGLPGDIPFAGDYTGDSKTDLAVYRPSTGTWYIAAAEGAPADNSIILSFGIVGDIPVPADYDNDGRDDIAVFRPSTGEWFSFLSGSFTAGYARWGLSTDIPVPGDYDGDGRYDFAIYRNGEWWILGSTAGPILGLWGQAGDIPIPATYIDPLP